MEDIIGRWTGELTNWGFPGPHGQLQKQIVANVAEGYKNSYLELYRDGTYKDFFPGDIRIGKWQLLGNELRLRPESAASRERRGLLSADRKHVTFRMSSPGELMVITYTRQ